ncbi:hypothetical protein [Elongatibacter sediminis]|uniref:Lipoprotein n=1 Tax=Elongatibacter sediminis TaxID=3119006 RepID=A0AAW9R5U5_9GAMM
MKRAPQVMLLLAVLITACVPNPVEKSRSEAFKQYETIVRWSQWDAAVDFLSPEYLAEHPITRLDMDRLRLFRVTQYTIRSARVFDEGRAAEQVVEIRLFNTNQAVERTIMDRQEWRYNPDRERWQLHSGLPDPTQGR